MKENFIYILQVREETIGERRETQKQAEEKRKHEIFLLW